MINISNLSKHIKNIAIWTIWYFCISWAILFLVFKFNMFSYTNWQHIMHARIHGFGGFAFGLFLITMIPLYIASCIVIINTKKFLINIPLPKFITNIFKHKTPTELKNTPENTEQSVLTDTTDYISHLPPELRSAFKRAKNHINTKNTQLIHPQEKIKQMIPQQLPSEPESNDFQIPTDFDTSEPTPQPSNLSTMPNFTDINFDSVPQDISENPPILSNEEKTSSESEQNRQNIITQIKNKCKNVSVQDDIIIADNFVIAIHDDPDFWIADDETWFATGKQCPSPVTKLIDIATKQKLQPIFLLQQNNILDFEEKLKTWESMGIKVINDISEL